MPEKTAARYVGVSVTLLRGEVAAGRLVRTRVSAGRFVYLRERLDAWLDAKDGGYQTKGKKLAALIG